MTRSVTQRAERSAKRAGTDSPESATTQARLAALVEGAADAISAMDLDGTVTDWNRSAEVITGFPALEMVGAPITKIVPPERAEEEKMILERIARGERIPPFESQSKTKNGALIDVSISISPICDDSGRVIGASRVMRELTDHKEQDQKFSHLFRLYSALSHINEAIAFSRSRRDLFEKLCHVLVNNGGFEMARIGWTDEATGTIVHICASDSEAEPAPSDSAPKWLDPESGPGKVLARNEPWVCADLKTDPEMASHSEVLRRFGYSSMAAFPIRENETARGILEVYSREPHFFRERETTLLAQAARNLSQALARLVERQVRRDAERAAAAERSFSDTMLEAMPGILYFYDQDLRFIRWNRNFELQSGYTADEIRELTPLSFFDEQERDLVESRIREVFKKGESSVEASFVSKDGTLTPFHFTGRRVRFNGKPCLVGVGFDISEHRRSEKRMRESEARYRTLFEYAPVGILIADSNARYLDANSSMCSLLGYTRDEIIGMHSSEIVSREEASHIDSAVESIQATGDYRRDWFFRRKDGSIFPAAVTATVMPDGNILAMIQDISEQKAAEGAMRKLNESLEDQVAERTRDLQATLLRAEAADRLKSAFLATMSHELRTPLNSILGFTGIILQELAGPLNDEQRKQLGMVRGSARHLLDLINDVLDLSKIEAGQLEVRASRFDLAGAIEHVVGLVRPLADKKQLSLRISIDDRLSEMETDKRRMEQILLNLLNNAIKFTETGGITLLAEPVKEDGVDRVRIRIVDTGVGIHPEDLDSLFQPFRQLDMGITRVHEGTGLGLAICKRLVSLLGGCIFAESEWGKGSTFTLVLPFQKPSVS